MTGANEFPEKDARHGEVKSPREKYRDRPGSEGKHGDGAQKPNEGYPTEGLPDDTDIGRGPGA
jgi:hypothetical protein